MLNGKTEVEIRKSGREGGVRGRIFVMLWQRCYALPIQGKELIILAGYSLKLHCSHLPGPPKKSRFHKTISLVLKYFPLWSVWLVLLTTAPVLTTVLVTTWWLRKLSPQVICHESSTLNSHDIKRRKKYQKLGSKSKWEAKESMANKIWQQNIFKEK